MIWQEIIAGAVISWPPAAAALWLGRRKLDRVTRSQTELLTDVTDAQTDWLRPGWREKRPRT